MRQPLECRPERAPAIRKVLDLSTRHLPPAVCSDLSGYEGVTAYPFEYGWLLWVPTDPTENTQTDNEEEDAFVPPAVLAIQVYARRYGCDYVLLDRDGAVNPSLESWNW